MTPDPALAEAEELLARCEEEPEHVRHVAALADLLFLDLAPWHRRGEDDRRRLRLAALLHDTGWSRVPDGKGHHKESARLIRAHPWRHLPPAEAALVAQIARYHRKALPSPGHPDYQALPAAHRAAVDLLAGLLRIADALDRSHGARVAAVRARDEGGGIALAVVPRPGADWEAERRAAERKKDLLERVRGGPVRIAD